MMKVPILYKRLNIIMKMLNTKKKITIKDGIGIFLKFIKYKFYDKS